MQMCRHQLEDDAKRKLVEQETQVFIIMAFASISKTSSEPARSDHPLHGYAIAINTCHPPHPRLYVENFSIPVRHKIVKNNTAANPPNTPNYYKKECYLNLILETFKWCTNPRIKEHFRVIWMTPTKVPPLIT